MFKIDIQQGSLEWKEMRQTKIGASEAAIILNESPYATPYVLWQQKTGRILPQKDNAAMAFGRAKEEEIREYYEEKTGEIFAPYVIQSHEFDFAIASLDGLSSNEKLILECKVCNKDIFDNFVKENKVPEHYFIQAQYQLAVTGCECVQFVFYNPTDNEYRTVEVWPCDDFIMDMMKKVKVFYEEHMLKDVAPALTEKDYVDMTEAWEHLHFEARNKYMVLQQAKKDWDFMKKQLIDSSDDGNCRGHGFTLTRVERQGSLDLKKMVEDGIDIEQYRKASIGYPKLTYKEIK
jgi:putative phage-type endonuclease